MDDPTFAPDGHATLGDLVQYAIAASVGRLFAQQAQLGAGDDREAVHQARVATRRLRSDLHTFAPLLEEGWADDLRDELRWLATLLGRVRDADVLTERFTAQAASLAEPDRVAARVLLDDLHATRAREQAILLDALASLRGRALHDRLAAAAASPRLAADATERATRARAVRLARRPWKKLRRAVRALPRHPVDEQLHEVRKRAKHARYALEAVAPVTGTRVARLARRVSDLQTVLGDHQDAVVASAWLRAAANDADERAVAFAAGALATGGAGDRARKWRPVWRRARTAADRVF